MKPFKYKNLLLEFEQVTGAVKGATKHSETLLRAGVPTIRSISITKQEFWLLTEHGEEIPINLEGNDIPLRDGQAVTVFRICKLEKYVIILYNHTANRHWIVKTPLDIIKDFKFVRGYRFHIIALILLPIIFFCAVLNGGTNQMVGVGVIAFEIAALAFLLIDYLRVRSEREQVVKALTIYYQSLVEDVPTTVKI